MDPRIRRDIGGGGGTANNAVDGTGQESELGHRIGKLNVLDCAWCILVKSGDVVHSTKVGWSCHVIIGTFESKPCCTISGRSKSYPNI